MTIPVFPTLPGLEWPITRSAISGKTLVQEAVSGKETRVSLWTFPRYKWSLSFSALRTSASLNEFQTLLAFLNTAAGQGNPFYFADPDDNAVTGQAFGVGDGTTTTFQLVRSFGGFVEPVQSPNVISFLGNSSLTPLSYTLGSAGIVTMASAPGSGVSLEWSGTYYWLCRFTDDTFDIPKDMAGIYSMKKLEFQSIKL